MHRDIHIGTHTGCHTHAVAGTHSYAFSSPTHSGTSGSEEGKTLEPAVPPSRSWLEWHGQRYAVSVRLDPKAAFGDLGLPAYCNPPLAIDTVVFFAHHHLSCPPALPRPFLNTPLAYCNTPLDGFQHATRDKPEEIVRSRTWRQVSGSTKSNRSELVDECPAAAKF
jgi:uncharacterized protein Usg